MGPISSAAGAFNAYGDPGGGGDDLAQRKQRLLQHMYQRGANQPYGALPLFGAGRSSHGGSDFPQAAMPQLSFNPFLAQIAGRGENFPQLPQGIDRITAASAQSSAPQTIGGLPTQAQGAPPGAPNTPMQQVQAPRAGVSGIPTQNLNPVVPTGDTGGSAPRNMFPAAPYVNPIIRDLTSNYYSAPAGNIHYYT